MLIRSYSLVFVTALLFCLSHFAWGKHFRNWKPRPPPKDKWWNLDYEEDITTDSEFESTTFRFMQNEENGTATRHCRDNKCDGTWGAWQPWSDCSQKLPGNEGPECHNTLHIRRRFCAQYGLCVQMFWEYCLHEPSCAGEWSEWSEFDGNCTTDCTRNITRTRRCYHNGVEASGLCLGAGTKAEQAEVFACQEQNCIVPKEMPTWKLILMIGAGISLLLIIFAIASVCFFSNHKGRSQETGLASSSSFLLRHWRIISRRFSRRRTYSEPQRQNTPELAIGNNYSAIHVYETPNDYAQVLDSAQGNIYEQTPRSSTYQVPFSKVETRSRSSTVVSEENYAVIGSSDAYACMEPLGNLTSKFRKTRRFHSCDDILTNDGNMNRLRHLPGATPKTPLFRGASEFPARKNTGLNKKPSNAGGVLARITKKRKITMERYNSSAHSSMDFFLEEDRYGYMVPNSNGPGNCAPWLKRETKTFSGFDTPSRSIINKSTSLPVDMDTYVTMKSSSSKSASDDKDGYRA